MKRKIQSAKQEKQIQYKQAMRRARRHSPLRRMKSQENERKGREVLEV